MLTTAVVDRSEPSLLDCGRATRGSGARPRPTVLAPSREKRRDLLGVAHAGRSDRHGPSTCSATRRRQTSHAVAGTRRVRANSALNPTSLRSAGYCHVRMAWEDPRVYAPA